MALDISRISGICFDIDGTLSDTDDQFVQRLNKWLKPFQFIFSERDILTISRRIIMVTESPATYLHGLPDRLGIDGILAGLGDYFYRKGLRSSPEPFSLIDGIDGMLEALYTLYPLGIVSARGESSVNYFLDQFHLNRYFQIVVTAQTCRRTKPHPSPILWAAENMGILPEECLMVGDTTVDITAGKSAGAQTVGVLCGFGEREELLNAGADLILETTSELISYMAL